MSARNVLLASALIFSGCAKTDNQVGPCVHTYEDPILHIVSLTNAQSSQTITQFRILEVTKGGYPQDPFLLKASASYNVVIEDTALVCNLPCGFGVEAGTYTLHLSAAGYRDTVVSCTAAYAVFHGGCPSSNSGGTEVGFAMQPR